MQPILEQLANATTIEWFADVRKHKFRVVAGAHAGVVKKLVLDSVSIGSGGDNDIVLFADSLAERHVQIERGKGLVGNMIVRALDAAVLVDRDERLEPGEQLRAKDMIRIDAGGATILVEKAIDTIALLTNSLKAGMLVGAFAAAVLAANLATSLVSYTATRGMEFMGRDDTKASVESKQSGMMDTGTKKKMAEATLWNVRMKLEELGINYLVRAAVTPDNAVRVYGTVPPAQAARWTQFLLWYDGNRDFPRLVREVRRSDTDPQMPSLQSVWLDGIPMAHFSDGNSAQAGDSISDGWKVVKIERSNVVLERDGSRVILAF